MALELTPAGLDTQTQQQIIEELTAKLRATFGNNLNTSVESIMGQLVNIVSEFRALDQQILLAVYRSFDPNSAVGVALDRLAALTGSVRDGATVSVVDGILTFSGPGTMPLGGLIQNDDTLTQWEAAAAYVSAGPWPEEIDATFSAVVPGALLANANTPWSSITPVPGLDSFTNPADDADVGQLAQTDPQFRESRQIELYAQNIGGLAAIRAVVSKVPGVVTVRVYHNPNNPAGVDGIPFKAFNVVVETNPSPPGPQLQQNIAEAIFSALGAGGEAFGTDYTRTVDDDEGLPHSVSFDLVTEIDVFAIVTLETFDTEQSISPNLADVVAAKLLESAQLNFNAIGQNQLEFEWSAIVSNLQDTGEISGVSGVIVQLSRVGFGGPFADPLQIEIRERPSFESVNIQVPVIS